MARSIEALESKLKRQQEEAAKTAKQLKEVAKAAKAKEAERLRKLDTRQKIIIGGFIKSKINQGDETAKRYYDEMIKSLTGESERKAFDLEPLPPKPAND